MVVLKKKYYFKWMETLIETYQYKKLKNNIIKSNNIINSFKIVLKEKYSSFVKVQNLKIQVLFELPKKKKNYKPGNIVWA